MALTVKRDNIGLRGIYLRDIAYSQVASYSSLICLTGTRKVVGSSLSVDFGHLSKALNLALPPVYSNQS